MSDEFVYCSEKHDVELRSFISEGRTLGAYSGMSGIPIYIIRSWLKKYPSFSAAYEKGYSEGLLYFENLGLQALEDSSANLDYKIYLLMKTHFKGDKQAVELATGDATQKMERLLPMLVKGAVSAPVATAIVSVCDRIHGYSEFEEAKEMLLQLKEKIA